MIPGYFVTAANFVSFSSGVLDGKLVETIETVQYINISVLQFFNRIELSIYGCGLEI